MDFAWLSVLWKWLKEAGFSTTSSVVVAAVIGVAIYLGRIAKGVREGYGVILDDQKKAAQEIRVQRDQLKVDFDKCEGELREERDEKLLALRALHDARVALASAGVAEPASVMTVLNVVAPATGAAIP